MNKPPEDEPMDNQKQSDADEEQLPEWEIGIRAWGPEHDPGEAEYEHYHPRAATKEEAIEKAEDEATGVGIDAIVGMSDAYEVYMVEGPFDVE